MGVGWVGANTGVLGRVFGGTVSVGIEAKSVGEIFGAGMGGVSEIRRETDVGSAVAADAAAAVRVGAAVSTSGTSVGSSGGG